MANDTLQLKIIGKPGDVAAQEQLDMRVRVDAAQSFAAPQKTQARGNIDAAALVHGHAIGDITDLATQLALKAAAADLALKADASVLPSKANLADADFTILKVAGRRVYGPLMIAASGGDTSDLLTSETKRLSVTFTAVGTNLLVTTNCYINTAGADGPNDTFNIVRLVRTSDSATITTSTGGHTPSNGLGWAGVIPVSLIASNLVVGTAYELSLNVWKAQPKPAYPHDMRICAINL